MVCDQIVRAVGPYELSFPTEPVGQYPLNPGASVWSHSIAQAECPADGSRWGLEVSWRFKPWSSGITSLVDNVQAKRGASVVGTESPSQARMHKRLGARLPLGGLLGAIAGALVGALVGTLFFERSAAILTSIFASAVFGLGVGIWWPATRALRRLILVLSPLIRGGPSPIVRRL
jgi:hypothetical protein